MTADRGAGPATARRAGATPDLGGLGLVVFDKDGTLIDFDAMWAGWTTDLARRLGHELGRPIDDRLFAAIGFDVGSGRAIAGGPLAATPMGQLRRLTVGLVAGVLLDDPADRRRSSGAAGVAGVTEAPGAGELGAGVLGAAAAAEAIVGRAWYPPDPVALAHPLADVPALFGALRDRGVRVAVATSDDRGPTEATLAALRVLDLVDVLVCADDGLAVKPAPDAILHACRAVGVEPPAAAMVGDAPADLEMARAAGVGLVVGVLSGVGRREDLEPLADVIVASIAELSVG